VICGMCFACWLSGFGLKFSAQMMVSGNVREV
jgi:hypothetical protein